jgi:hypothetical protein
VARPGLSIDETARFLGHATWVERRLFTILGEWVASTPEPPAKLAFARQSRRHGAHAQLIAGLRPDTRDHHPEEQTRPLDDGWRDRVEELAHVTDTGARIVALGEVVARAVSEAEERLAATRPFRDGPTRRVLHLVVDEERGDLAELDRLDAGARRGAR